MPNADPVCAVAEIPEYLHQCGRGEERLEEGELLYKFFHRNERGKIEKAIRFEQDNSSSFVARLCLGGPSDALYLCTPPEKGQRQNSGVLSFPLSFRSTTWPVSGKGKPDKVYRLDVVHDPVQCNFAHSDFRLFEDGMPVKESPPSAVKIAIRRHLVETNSIKVEIEPPGTEGSGGA